MRVSFRAVLPVEYGDCLSLWQTCFDHYCEATFARFVQIPSTTCFLLGGYADGRLVSTTQVIPRVLQEPPTTIISGYVTNVCTHPDFRRQGMATRLLQQALERMHAEGLPLCRLIATDAHLYTKLGWQTTPLPLLEGQIPVWFDLPPSRYQVRAATSEELPALAILYEQNNRERPLTVQRSLDYWRQWLCSPQHDFLCPTLICQEGAHIVGYAQMYRHPTWGPLLAEIAAHENSPDIFTTLLTHMAHQMRQSGGSLLRLAVPIEAPIITAIRAVLTNVQCWATLPWMYRELTSKSIQGNFTRPDFNGRSAHTWWFDGF